MGASFTTTPEVIPVYPAARGDSVPQTPWRNQTVIEKIQEASRRTKTVKSMLERTWLVDMAFYSGEQWVGWNKTLKQLKNLPNAKGDVRLTINLIQQRVRRYLSSFVMNRPVYEAHARKTDDRAEDIASIVQHLSDWLWSYLDLTLKSERFGLWLSTTGNVFGQIGWDPNMGDMLPEDIEKLAKTYDVLRMPGDKVRADDDRIPFRNGDVYLDAVPAFEMAFHPRAETVEDSRWTLRTKYMHVEDARMRFNTRKIEPDQDYATQSILESRITSLFGNLGFFDGRFDIRKEEDLVLVREFIEKPWLDQPRGQISVLINQDQLFGPMDMQDDTLPYVHIGAIPTHTLWYESFVRALVSPQVNYNRIQSLIYKNLRAHGNPRLLNPQQANVDEFTDEPGEIIDFTWTAPSAEPHFLEPPQIPRWFGEISRMRVNEMDDMTFHEVSRGQVPEYLRSGIAVQTLQGADQMMVEHVFKRWDSCWTKIMRKLIAQIARNYDVDRIMAIVGDDTDMEVAEFQAADLQNEVEVSVVPGSTYPTTRTEKRSIVGQLVQMGFLNPQDPKDKSLGFKLMDVASFGELREEETAHRRRQRREIKKMLMGERVIPREDDNHLIHINELMKFRVRASYDDLSDSVKKLVDEHDRIHQGIMSGFIRIGENGEPVQANANQNQQQPGLGIGPGRQPQSPGAPGLQGAIPQLV